jgi:hypothetical protein
MTAKAFAGHLRCVTTHFVSTKRLRQLRDSQVPIIIMTGTPLSQLPDCFPPYLASTSPHLTSPFSLRQNRYD